MVTKEEIIMAVSDHFGTSLGAGGGSPWECGYASFICVNDTVGEFDLFYIIFHYFNLLTTNVTIL